MANFKEGVLHCEDCGHKATLPNANCKVALDDYVAMANAFMKRHKKCEKGQ